jgi:hypothetical protein
MTKAACTTTAGKLGAMDTTLTLPARFNGPPDSGNGGFSCGMLAAFINGPARVRLHVPPPLDTPMVVREIEQQGFGMFAGETLVGSAFPTHLELDVPPAPSLDSAADASTRYPCYEHHVFPTCFVCGPGRPSHDGLDVFAGPLKNRGVLASPWTPAPDLLDEKGNVRAEIVWAALDCPGYFACMGSDIRPAVLGELQLDLPSPVRGGQPLVVFSWPLGEEGRKLYAGAALADATGQVLARARSTWILLRR